VRVVVCARESMAGWSWMGLVDISDFVFLNMLSLKHAHQCQFAYVPCADRQRETILWVCLPVRGLEWKRSIRGSVPTVCAILQELATNRLFQLSAPGRKLKVGTLSLPRPASVHGETSYVKQLFRLHVLVRKCTCLMNSNVLTIGASFLL